MAVVGVGVAAALSIYLWWDNLGVTVDGVIFDAWQVLPFLLTAALRLRRTLSMVATVILTALLAVVTVASQIDVYNSDSSTAAVAFVFTPVYLCGAVLIAWFLDAVVRRLARWLGGGAGI